MPVPIDFGLNTWQVIVFGKHFLAEMDNIKPIVNFDEAMLFHFWTTEYKGGDLGGSVKQLATFPSILSTCS